MSSSKVKVSCICCQQQFHIKSIFRHFQRKHPNMVSAPITVEDMERNKRINYSNDPTVCKGCADVLPYERRKESFCGSSCAASYNNRKRPPVSEEQKIKTSRTLKLRYITTSKKPSRVKRYNKVRFTNKIPFSAIYQCLACGKYHRTTADVKQCQCGLGGYKRRLFNCLTKYFGLPLHNIGSPEFITDYNTCIAGIVELYRVHSSASLAALIGHTHPSGLVKLMKAAGIKVDSRSESRTKSLLLGRRSLPSNDAAVFQQGWYHTKFGTDVYYRSSYELAYIHHLEDRNIAFTMEDRFEYYDTQKGTNRCALPDFIVGDIIVEIKSSYTFDNPQNMKDKFNAYSEKGFEPILYLEFQYYKLIDGEFVKQSDDYDPFM